MQRIRITISTKRGEGIAPRHLIAYDANHISIERRVNEKGESVSQLSFLSSGSRVTLDADEIESIELQVPPQGASWCSDCDQSIDSIVGEQ